LSRKPIRIAGVDEAGRGPLAGPVVAAAVILDPRRPIAGLADSKALSAKRREALAGLIVERALAVGVGIVEADVIDRINILQATMLAMREAVNALDPLPDEVLIDGNRAPELGLPTRTLVGGDALDQAISAASIIAKTRRDGIMVGLHARYPEYGFDRHKGYPTKGHLDALERWGACEVHRRSFGVVGQLGLF
jgi:ribonuclease HII